MFLSRKPKASSCDGQGEEAKGEGSFPEEDDGEEKKEDRVSSRSPPFSSCGSSSPSFSSASSPSPRSMSSFTSSSSTCSSRQQSPGLSSSPVPRAPHPSSALPSSFPPFSSSSSTSESSGCACSAPPPSPTPRCLLRYVRSLSVFNLSPSSSSSSSCCPRSSSPFYLSITPHLPSSLVLSADEEEVSSLVTGGRPACSRQRERAFGFKGLSRRNTSSSPCREGKEVCGSLSKLGSHQRSSAFSRSAPPQERSEDSSRHAPPPSSSSSSSSSPPSFSPSPRQSSRSLASSPALSKFSFSDCSRWSCTGGKKRETDGSPQKLPSVTSGVFFGNTRQTSWRLSGAEDLDAVSGLSHVFDLSVHHLLHPTQLHPESSSSFSRRTPQCRRLDSSRALSRLPSPSPSSPRCTSEEFCPSSESARPDSSSRVSLRKTSRYSRAYEGASSSSSFPSDSRTRLGCLPKIADKKPRGSADVSRSPQTRTQDETEEGREEETVTRKGSFHIARVDLQKLRHVEPDEVLWTSSSSLRDHFAVSCKPSWYVVVTLDDGRHLTNLPRLFTASSSSPPPSSLGTHLPSTSTVPFPHLSSYHSCRDGISAAASHDVDTTASQREDGGHMKQESTRFHVKARNPSRGLRSDSRSSLGLSKSRAPASRHSQCRRNTSPSGCLVWHDYVASDTKPSFGGGSGAGGFSSSFSSSFLSSSKDGSNALVGSSDMPVGGPEEFSLALRQTKKVPREPSAERFGWAGSEQDGRTEEGGKSRGSGESLADCDVIHPFASSAVVSSSCLLDRWGSLRCVVRNLLHVRRKREEVDRECGLLMKDMKRRPRRKEEKEEDPVYSTEADERTGEAEKKKTTRERGFAIREEGGRPRRRRRRRCRAVSVSSLLRGYRHPGQGGVYASGNEFFSKQEREEEKKKRRKGGEDRSPEASSGPETEEHEGSSSSRGKQKQGDEEGEEQGEGFQEEREQKSKKEKKKKKTLMPSPSAVGLSICRGGEVGESFRHGSSVLSPRESIFLSSFPCPTLHSVSQADLRPRWRHLLRCVSGQREALARLRDYVKKWIPARQSRLVQEIQRTHQQLYCRRISVFYELVQIFPVENHGRDRTIRGLEIPPLDVLERCLYGKTETSFSSASSSSYYTPSLLFSSSTSSSSSSSLPQKFSSSSSLSGEGGEGAEGGERARGRSVSWGAKGGGKKSSPVIVMTGQHQGGGVGLGSSSSGSTHSSASSVYTPPAALSQGDMESLIGAVGFVIHLLVLVQKYLDLPVTCPVENPLSCHPHAVKLIFPSRRYPFHHSSPFLPQEGQSLLQQLLIEQKQRQFQHLQDVVAERRQKDAAAWASATSTRHPLHNKTEDSHSLHTPPGQKKTTTPSSLSLSFFSLTPSSSSSAGGGGGGVFSMKGGKSNSGVSENSQLLLNPSLLFHRNTFSNHYQHFFSLHPLSVYGRGREPGRGGGAAAEGGGFQAKSLGLPSLPLSLPSVSDVSSLSRLDSTIFFDVVAVDWKLRLPLYTADGGGGGAIVGAAGNSAKDVLKRQQLFLEGLRCIAESLDEDWLPQLGGSSSYMRRKKSRWRAEDWWCGPGGGAGASKHLRRLRATQLPVPLLVFLWALNPSIRAATMTRPTPSVWCLLLTSSRMSKPYFIGKCGASIPPTR